MDCQHLQQFAEIAGCIGRFSGDRLDQAALSRFLSAELVSQDGHVGQVACPHCCSNHLAKVEVRGASAWVWCREYGLVETELSAVQGYRVQNRVVVTAIREALACGHDRARRLIGSDAWVVGRSALSADFTLTTLYLPSLGTLSDLSELHGELSRLPVYDGNLIVVGACDADALPAENGRFKLCPLSTLFRLNRDGSLMLREEELRRIYPISTKSRKGRPRKGDQERLCEVLQGLDKQEPVPSRDKLWALVIAKAPDVEWPSASTIERRAKELRAEGRI